MKAIVNLEMRQDSKMSTLLWKLRLENDVFAKKHVIHIFMLVSAEIFVHYIMSLFLPEFMAVFPVTQIITLLIYKNTHEQTKLQFKKVLQTTFLGVILALPIAVYFYQYVWTLPLSFCILILFLYFTRLPFYLIPAGIIVIIAYFNPHLWYWYLILYCDITIFSVVALLLSKRFNVTSFNNFQENYQKLRFEFDNLATAILQFNQSETTHYFQRILRLEDILKEIKKEGCVSYSRLLLLDQLLQEVNETYFYLRSLNGKTVRDEVYEFHFQKLSFHYRAWINLENKLQDKDFTL